MSVRRTFATLIVSALAASSLGLAVATPAAADNGVTLTKGAPASVLLGDDIPYELTAKNAGPGAQYNVGFSDVLPMGFRYKAGSVSPAIGEPTITTNGSGQKVLAWTNVTDLQANSDYTISFKAEWDVNTPDEIPPSLTPSDFNNATVATQSNPRLVPKFDQNGVPLTPPATPSNVQSKADASATTQRAPFVIEKEEPSPEGELLRGVHDQRTVYTLTVRNNKVVPTTGIHVTDYLPAGLEFLNCGNVDNSAPGVVEYPNAPRLGVPVYNKPPGPECPVAFQTPNSVDTVTSPAGISDPGNPSNVWTQINWTVGNLAKGAETTIKYVAGIPLKENTDNWGGGKPTKGSLKQGANLDNNDGASTRELGDERKLTNYASATGNFTGSPPGEYSATTKESVSIEDIRMQKSVDPTKFTPSGIATFSLKVDASEYMDGSDIVVTDTLPDGFCPLGPANYAPGGPTDCAPVTGKSPSVPYTSVTPNADGTYTIVFDPIAVQANKTMTITFPARMRDEYRATSVPTVAGDSFTNTASLTGTTTPIPGVAGIEPGDRTVGDASEASQSTDLPTIDKQVQATRTPVDCVTATYTATVPKFQKGDRVCFLLRVTFPDIKTKNAVVTDFLPPDSEYIAGSAQVAETVSVKPGDPSYTDLKGPLTWELGDAIGSDRFVPANKVFVAVFAVRLLDSAGGVAPEITGNLMKMRTVNTIGDAESYRDQADFTVAPPSLAIVKGAVATDKPAGTTWPMPQNPGLDTQSVQQGSTTTFRIDVKNNEPTGDGATVLGVQTWDVLPPGIACSEIGSYSAIEPNGTIIDPLPAQYVKCEGPSVNGQTASSYIKWNIPANANGYSIPPGQRLSLLYQMTIPNVVNPNTAFLNTAHVRSFETDTNDGGSTAYFPANNIDVNVTDQMENAPALQDNSRIRVSNTSVAKSAVTSVDETNNVGTAVPPAKPQATIGETITYTYSATIPAGSTVYNGILSDALPTGIELTVPFEGDWELVGSSKPGGFTFDTTTGTLTFPQSYSNNTSAAQVFRVTVDAQVTQEAIPCANGVGTPANPCVVPPPPGTGEPKLNTATFSRTPRLDGGTPLNQNAPYTVDIVQPNPSITKTANPTSVTSTATDITYTLTAKTPGSRPPLHDVTIIDCVPDTLTVKTVNNGVLGTNTNCQTTGQVSITWGPFDPLEPGVDKVVTYVANIKPGSPADVKFKNTVGMSGTSLPGDVAGERTYLTGANAEVFITGASIDKSVTPSVAKIGETATYTIDTKLPDATYQNLVVLDTLPPYIDNADVSGITLQCFTTDSSYQNPVACSSAVTATPLGPDPASPGATGQQIGWSFDPLPNQDKHRIIRITYNSRVSNVPQNVAGVTRTNTASAGYGYASKPTTLAAAQNPPKPIGSKGATITLTEPNLKILKRVNLDASITALPDDTFEYLVYVTNPKRAGGVPTSPAYAVKVRDCVPDGIVVVSAGAGLLTTDDSCSTTDKVAITWTTIDSLAVDGPGEQYTYTAKLKGNATTAQTNVVSALEWFSMTPDSNNPDIRKYGPITADAVVTPVLPDVKIEKKASADLAYIGQPYTWTIEVTNPSTRNPGPTAYQVKVADVLPPNWTYKADSTVMTFDGGPVTNFGLAVDSTDPLAVKLAWDTKTDLPANKKIVITFQAIPGADVVDDPGVGIDVTPKVPHINTANTTWNPGKPTDGWTPVTSGNVTAQTGIAAADLQLTKSHVTDYTPPLQDDDKVIPGTQFKWKLQVKNNGPDNAVGPYVVVDTLPAGNTYVGSQGTDWTCDQDQVNAQKITCTHPNVAPGGLAKDASLPDLLLTVSVDIDAPPTMENTATVTGKTYDPNLDNNTGKDTVTPLPPNVQIQKFNSDAVAYIDQPYSWRLEITNPSQNIPGPTAYQVRANDVLPPNWTYKAGSTVITLDGTEISKDDPTVDSTDPLAVKLAWDTKTDLPVNMKIVITFQATPGADVVDDPGVGIDVTPKVPHINTANTSWYPGTPTSNWQLQTSENVTAQTEIALADLRIVKFHRTSYPKAWNVAKNEVVPGTEFEWVLQVSNNGPDPSVGPFTVVDTLPAGVEFRGYNDGSGWSCNAVGQVVTCTNPGPIGGLAKGASLEDLVLTVYVDAGATAKQLNTATVSGKTLDPNPGNNTATDEVTLRPLADLEIVKSRTKPYVVGNQVTYTLAVTNLGPSVSGKDITVEDTLPAGLSIASIDSGSWDCTPKTGETDKIACTLKEDLAPTAQADLIKITVDVLEAPGAPEAVNTAKVTPTTEDPNLGNNTSTVTDPVVSQVQLGIAKKTTGANPVTAGQSTEFTITVTNAGPAKAKNVQVVDQLEAGLRATSATGAGWTCDVGSGTVVTCTRANFPVSASPSDIVIKADVDKAVPGGTTLKNTATVTTTSPQEVTPHPATSTVDVVAKSDLAIVKTHNGGPWTIGKQGTWNVTVTNNGPSDNPGPITVTDTLPQGNEFVSATGDGWTCSANGRVVTCERATGLQVTQSAAFSIRVNVVNGAAPSVVNPAEVTSPIEDPDPSNNKATDQVPVERAKQTAGKLPPDPSVIPARKTEQGQKIRTKVRCRPLQASSAGEASFCKVRRSKNGTIRVKVFGSRPVRVIVTQFAKGTDDYKPFTRVRKYIVRP